MPRSLRTGAVRGALAFGAVVLAGQVVALVVLIAGGPGSLSATPRIGWLYTCAFLGVPLELTTSSAAADELTGTVRLTLGTGTALLLWICWRGGHRDGASVAIWAAAVTGGCAAAGAWLTGAVLTISLAVPRNPVVGDVDVRPEPVAAFAVAFVLAALAGLAGAAAAGRGTTGVIVDGGVRMFVTGLAAAFAFVLVLAATRPDATAAYVRAITAPSGAVTAAALGHHVLAAPDQSVWLLAAGTGACPEVRSDRDRIDLVCPRTIPDALSLDLLTPGTGVPPATRAAPWEFLLLPAVPLVAAVFGGRHAGRRAGTSIGAPIGAGLVFAVLLGVASWFATVTLAGPLLAGMDGAVRYGPDPSLAAVLGALWGTLGGAAGGWLARREGAGR